MQRPYVQCGGCQDIIDNDYGNDDVCVRGENIGWSALHESRWVSSHYAALFNVHMLNLFKLDYMRNMYSFTGSHSQSMSMCPTTIFDSISIVMYSRNVMVLTFLG